MRVGKGNAKRQSLGIVAEQTVRVDLVTTRSLLIRNRKKTLLEAAAAKNLHEPAKATHCKRPLTNMHSRASTTPQSKHYD